ncbi:MAG TPA: cbb3-type cytochrome oxidase assembly protein CcoS [Solimonas sp.]|nr:cbb3-type cytochrome oxidase assembly protein CcoS [Solimonas sp.]
MESLYLLIPLGIVVVVAAAVLLAWSIGSGQYEELEEWSQRLPDDD